MSRKVVRWCVSAVLMALVCLVLPGSVGAQADTVTTLRQQEQAIKHSISTLQKSESQLASQISADLKAAFDKEISDKQAALAALQNKLHQANSIQNAITALKSVKIAAQGHASAAFLSSLETELQNDEKTLAGLATESPNRQNTTAAPSTTSQTVGDTNQAANGPNGIPVCDQKAPKPPCVDQPHAGDTQVTGEVVVEKGATYAVAVKVNGSAVGAGATVNANTGAFTEAVKALSEYDRVEVDQTAPTALSGTFTVVKQTSQNTGQSLYTLGMAGVDITSTTTSGPRQQYFAEFELTAPLRLRFLRCSQDDPLENRCWLWFNPRIASIPTPKTTQISSLTSANSALSGLASMTLGDITQSAEFEGGFEYALVKPRHGIFFGERTRPILSVSAIAGGGIVTPFNSQTTAQEFDLLSNGKPTNVAQQFASNPNFTSLYPQLASVLALCPYNTTLQCGSSNPPTSTPPTPIQHVAFVLPNRSRFYRNWRAGFRFKTVFFNSNCNPDNIKTPNECKPLDVFPGLIDFTFGQDETVSAGHLRRFVFTLSGNYPFPGTTWLRIFGDAHIGISGNRHLPALALSPTPAPGFSLSDPSVLVQTVNPEDQDYLRLGFGIDIVRAFQALKQKQSQMQDQTAAGGP